MLEKKADNEPAISLPVYFKSDKKMKICFRKKKDKKKKTKKSVQRREVKRLLVFLFHPSG